MNNVSRFSRELYYLFKRILVELDTSYLYAKD